VNINDKLKKFTTLQNFPNDWSKQMVCRFPTWG